MPEERRWTREHRGNPPLWHYYPDDENPALCGKEQIPGAPLVSARVPIDWQDSKICRVCFEQFPTDRR